MKSNMANKFHNFPPNQNSCIVYGNIKLWFDVFDLSF